MTMIKTRTNTHTNIHTQRPRSQKWLTLIPSLLLTCLLSVSAVAQDDDWAPDQPIGSILPTFTLPDSEGNPIASSNLSGPNGMFLLFSRSTDW